MSVTVTFHHPPDLEKKIRESKDLDTEVKEAFALELFRQGRISHFELSQVLNLDRFETDAYLKQHQVFEGSLDAKEVDADVTTLSQLLGNLG